MVNTSTSCPVPTNTDKLWTYQQYYTGDKDAELRKNGHGENHWSGPESLESYNGCFLRDTMHGVGEYRCRYRGVKGIFTTFEGHFYANRMHGYGTMSYADGNVFTGMFHNDIRWGPGIESQACLREDVGLWRGNQLVRLAWQPSTPSVTLDLIGPNGKACVAPHRIILTAQSKTIGEVNSAIELLKQSGAEPIVASENWMKLYPKNCTDIISQMCHIAVFERSYYHNNIRMLEEGASNPVSGNLEGTEGNDGSIQEPEIFYAWNNNEMIIHMMKHCFKHEQQRLTHGVDIKPILSGPRTTFKGAGKHEIHCRTTLMASYLGHIIDVAQIVNEFNIYPDISDNQGNTALMYAACGDQVDTIHFLVEAGADVNSFNDACCTPLGVTLMRFTCAKKDIAASGMIQALLPPPVIPPPPPQVPLEPSEWHIARESTVLPLSGALTRSPSKIAAKGMSTKKIKQTLSEDISKKRIDLDVSKATDFTNNDSDIFSEENKLYNSMNAEFSIRVTDLFSPPIGPCPVSYLFEINDMIKEVEASEEDQKKPPEKNPKKVVSKVIKDTIKPSKEVMWQSSDKEFGSINSADKSKIELLSRIMHTILQLLSDGADPKLVRCPQSALLMATVSGCPELVRHLANYGADVNEVYPQSLNYTALDVAVSRPFSQENLNMIIALLECGANTNHRLRYAEPEEVDLQCPVIPGPTLLHAVLARKTENDVEEELRLQLLELLLKYNCDPMVQFMGRSAVDVAMGKDMDIFDIFIKSPQTNLNAVINDSNETVLVKLFTPSFCKAIPTTERLQTITNLLLFGADPLLEIHVGEIHAKNLFVYAKNILADMENPQLKSGSPKDVKTAGKADVKSKTPEKPKKDEKLSVKSIGKLAVDDVGDYKQSLDVMTECSRILYIRSLQAKLFKELLEVVVKYKHRRWNMILPEHKNKKACGLWLTSVRCLEIWNILKTTKRKVFREIRVLKHILCIVQFYIKRTTSGFKHRMTAEEKDMIESIVKYTLYDQKVEQPLFLEGMPYSRPYVMPELEVKTEEKFNICFECALPFEEQTIQCSSCKLVSFCSLDCMSVNIERIGCHPCSEYLRIKYFPTPDDSVTQFIVDV